MSRKIRSPKRYANDISTVLNTAIGINRYPINVIELAKEYSHHCFPSEPITKVEGASLPGFEGAIYPASTGKKRWAILYNNDMSSNGRINYTLAHEFGHYLLHRIAFPKGLQCSTQDTIRWDSLHSQIEQQANEFAATLLMPLDDYRKNLKEKEKATFDDISGCADRYDVSLIAATLRWLQYTIRHACLVVSVDGFILWSRSSPKAYKVGIYFKSGQPLPPTSLAALNKNSNDKRLFFQHGNNVWHEHETEEQTIISEKYDFTISLVYFSS